MPTAAERTFDDVQRKREEYAFRKLVRENPTLARVLTRCGDSTTPQQIYMELLALGLDASASACVLDACRHIRRIACS